MKRSEKAFEGTYGKKEGQSKDTLMDKHQIYTAKRIY